MTRHSENGEKRVAEVPKKGGWVLRPYRYLTVARNDRENPHLVTELVRCGKLSCGCAHDVRRQHGPYTYLRFEEWDEASQQVRYRRE